MTILIATQNKEIVTKLQGVKKFEESTKNTCTFSISKNRFNKLFNDLRSEGYNPYAFMYW